MPTAQRTRSTSSGPPESGDFGELVDPAFLWVPDHRSSAGSEVGDLARSVGLIPEPEQQLALDVLLAERPDGRWAAFEGAIVAGRQNLKTFVFGLVALGDIYLFDLELVVWTAHEFNTAMESFRWIRSVIEGSPFVSKRVKKVNEANGDEGIEFHGGQRLRFKARTKTGGRGLTGDRVFLDEAFALQPSHMGSLMPTMSAKSVHGNPGILYGSSAGRLNSSVLRNVRDRGRAGGDPRLAYIEWSSSPDACVTDGCDHHVGVEGCAFDDVGEIRKANPMLGRRISVEFVATERRALPPSEYAAERMCWWEDPPEGDGGEFNLEAWLSLADGLAARGANPVFGVDVGEDRIANVAVAWLRPDGMPQVMLADVGLSPLRTASRLSQLVGDWKGPVMLGGPASDLEDEVKGSIVVPGTDFAAACGRFEDLFKDRALRHGNQAPLNEAVRTARWRNYGTSGARTLQLSNAPQVGPLAAVVRALHGLFSQQAPPPAPPLSAKAAKSKGGESFTADLSTIGF